MGLMIKMEYGDSALNCSAFKEQRWWLWFWIRQDNLIGIEQSFTADWFGGKGGDLISNWRTRVVQVESRWPNGAGSDSVYSVVLVKIF